ncbi:MAG: hypothetical protein FJY21_12855 [Bacteroidetes bacterium]|nr:hypothetical protein [Bacteroidota bacterium]
MSIIDLNIIDDLIVTREQGGMREFSKTGVYPDYVVFYSGKLKKRWKQKVIKENQKGQVKSEGIVFFNYELSDNGCRVLFVGENTPNSEWINLDLITIMFD